MAEEETSSRIAELKARLEADPGSRVFYQLGEELRKSGQTEEAESVLREGLQKHSSYLSAWISLGRVLKEGRPHEAIEVLNRAFELDRQNVVVARLLGDAYSDIGEPVEAIKKYKLVAALHPADEEIQDRIAEIERILQTEGKLEERHAQTDDAAGTGAPDGSAGPEHLEEPEEAADPFPAFTSSVEAADSSEEGPVEAGGGSEEDSWPSPLTEDAGGEQNLPIELDAREQGDEDPERADIDTAPASEEDQWSEEPRSGDDVVSTITMGDLYARQGHVDQARDIYRSILEREPEHGEARERLESLSAEDQHPEETDGVEPSSGRAKVRRLEDWLSRVRR